MQTDRRTRDRVRVFFWVVLSVVCVVAVLAARQQQRQALDRKATSTQERIARYTQSVLARPLTADRVHRPIERSGYTSLMTTLRHGLLGDPRTARVRVWRPDGLLVFTSDDPSKIGKLSQKDAGMRAALGGTTESIVSTQTFAPDAQTTPQPTELLATYVPLRASATGPAYGVVEVDTYYAPLRDGSSSPWKQLQLAFAIVALLCLVMTGLAFVWSRRPQEVVGFGPSRRDVRAAARDEKKLGEARAEATTLRQRVATLEREAAEASKAVAAATASQAAAPDPAETEQLRARARQLEEQTRNAEGRMGQLQSRVTELEAQLRLTTDQLRSAQQRAEAAPGDMEQKLRSAEEAEQALRDELQAARADVQRLEQERDAAEQRRTDETREQQGQLDQAHAQARLAEEERQRILAEAAKGAASVEPVIAPDAASKIRELEETLARSEHERAMLRAGRPETVYEARNRELEDELASIRARAADAEQQARLATAAAAGVDVDVIASLEARVAAAEERAKEAERRLDARPSRRAAKAPTNGASETGGDDVSVDEGETDGAATDAEAPVDGSELRSRLVRSTDARRRGSTPAPERPRAPNRR